MSPPISTIAVTGPWSIDSLHQYLVARIDAIEKINDLQFEHLANARAQVVAIVEGRFAALEARHDERDTRYQQRFDAQQEAVKIALSGVDVAVSTRLAAAIAAVEKSDAAHEKIHASVDVRYQQRFEAQQNALSIALAAVDKEFHEHIKAARDETRAAMEAADKAITKQERSTEERFHSVNEFRAQLTDQTRSFMPRTEAEQRGNQNAEKIAALETRVLDALAQINSRLDITAGQAGGSAKVQAAIFSVVAAFVGIAGIALAIFSR